ncbi:MAG: PorV/PorQ family protein, partial [candidate division Zixibacteria bacterium]|nr:PorV/PorQ family protein [candidate division Zixibacteria bacterium]
MAITHINYLLDINLNYVAYAKRIEGLGVFGASVTMLSMGDQEITTIDDPEGTGDFYSASSWAFQLGFAKDLTANFSFGGSFKVIGEKIHRETASGFAFDFGTMLYTGYRSLRLGMNISNMGPGMKFDGPDLKFTNPNPENPNQELPQSTLSVDSYDLPLTFRIGLAYDIDFGNSRTLTLSAEAKHPNDNLQKGGLGAEFNWMNRYFLRGGYKFNYEEEGLALGGGISTPLSETSDL